MKEPLDFVSAWQSFYGSSDSRPSDTDYRKAREVMELLGATSFSVTANYITDSDHKVHVNPGFLIAKVPFPGGHPDDVYEEQGFCCRLWFTNHGSGGGPKETTNLVKVLCPRQFVRVNAGVPCDYCGDTHLAN